MPRTNNEWTNLDRLLMQAVINRWNTMENPPSLRAVAREIGVSAPRVMDLRDHRNGRPLVDEYVAMCDLFNLDAADTLREALEATKE